MMVSLMVVTLIYISTLISTKKFLSIELFLAIIFIIIVYFMGRDLVKSRYRSRARRIYQNYLDKDFQASNKKTVQLQEK